MLDQILPAEDKDMARVVERAFKKQNITISTGTKVENVEASERVGQVQATATSEPRSTTCASPAAGGPTPSRSTSTRPA